MNNTRIRQFREQLMELVNQYSDVPMEARYMALLLVFNKVTELSNEVILEEMKEKEVQDGESV